MTTTAAELRELDDDELENRLINARKELFNLRFQAATGRLDNSARTGDVRRDIARMLTVARAREAEPTPVAAGRPPSGRRRRRRNEEE
jgi:large subunit ribosomal protein L29